MPTPLEFYTDHLDWLSVNPRVLELSDIAPLPYGNPWLPQGRETPFEVRTCADALVVLAGRLLDRLARDTRKTYKHRERITEKDAREIATSVFSSAEYIATGGFRHVFRIDLSPFSMNGKLRPYILKLGHTLCPATGWEAQIYQAAKGARVALAKPFFFSATVGLFEEVIDTRNARKIARSQLLPICGALDIRDDLPSNFGIANDGRSVIMDYAEPSKVGGYSDKYVAAELFAAAWKLG